MQRVAELQASQVQEDIGHFQTEISNFNTKCKPPHANLLTYALSCFNKCVIIMDKIVSWLISIINFTWMSMNVHVPFIWNGLPCIQILKIGIFKKHH